MGSKKKVVEKTNSTSTAAPPSWAQPTMMEIAKQLMAGVNKVQSLPLYSGDFVAQPGALQEAVPGAYLNAAHVAQSLVPTAQHALDMSFTDPTYDVSGMQLQPALQGFAAGNPGGMDAAIAAAINPVRQQLVEQILPSLASAGIESGAYGGTRSQQTLPELALRDFSGQAGDIAARMRYQDYNDTANRVLQGYGLATDRGLGEADLLTQRLGLTPDLLDAVMRMTGGAAELQAQGAGYDTANRQSVIDDMLQKYQYQMSQPFMGYDVATDLIARLAGNYGTTTNQGTSTTVQKTGGLAPVLGGLLGAGMSLASLPMGGGGSLGGSLVSSLFGRKGG